MKYRHPITGNVVSWSKKDITCVERYWDTKQVCITLRNKDVLYVDPEQGPLRLGNRKTQ